MKKGEPISLESSWVALTAVELVNFKGHREREIVLPKPFLPTCCHPQMD